MVPRDAIASRAADTHRIAEAPVATALRTGETSLPLGELSLGSALPLRRGGEELGLPPLGLPLQPDHALVDFICAR